MIRTQPLGILLASTVACSTGSGDNAGAKPTAVPAVRVELTVAGKSMSPIAAAHLTGVEPRANDSTGTGWLLTDILPMPWPEGTVLTAVGKNGIRAAFRDPRDRARMTLFVMSTGDAYIARTDPGQMFSPTGPPSPATRVGVLAELQIGESPVVVDAGPPPSVTVSRDGQPDDVWSLERLATLPGAIDSTVPLPALAAAIGATNGLELATATGETLAVTADQLASTTARPRLRLNKRGMLKLEFVDATGKRTAGGKLRGVVTARPLP